MSCGQQTGVQGHSMGQRIREAGWQGTGAAVVCALLQGWGRQSPVLGGDESLPSDAQATAHPFGAEAPLEWGLVGGEGEVSPLEGGSRVPPHPHAPSQLLPLPRKGQPKKAPRSVGFEKQGWAGCRSARGTQGKKEAGVGTTPWGFGGGGSRVRNRCLFRLGPHVRLECHHPVAQMALWG